MAFTKDQLIKLVEEQGAVVKALKEQGADFKADVEKLKEFKSQLQVILDAEKAEADAKKKFRADLEDVLLRRFFYVPSFEIYGGVGGLYDFGPPGCAIKTSIMETWRNHFVLAENMLEVSCSALTPEVVLKTSGHVDKFTDFMVRDEVTADCHRADKLVEEFIEKLLEDTKNPVSAERKNELSIIKNKAGAMNAKELKETIDSLQIKSPDTNNNLSDPFPFNLMFGTPIGPTGKFQGYLRPETAQGIFVNFRRLLDFNAGKMPFAAAQIGLAFRNEIAPRAGLLRVREFPLAEIEHFVNGTDKSHPKFKNIAHVEMSLLDRECQEMNMNPKVMTIGEAVEKGIVNNQTLGYYMARTQLFLLKIGCHRDKIRFRQHLSNEMAHYAKDCWDAEIHSSYGWVECVGHADRACYDLEMHSKVSKVELVAHETFDVPKIVQKANLILDNGLIGRLFKGKAKDVTEYLRGLDKDAAVEVAKKLHEEGSLSITTCNGEEFKLEKAMIKEVKIEEQKISSMKYIPSVIEPSFGLGRIMYSLLEHSFNFRADDKKGSEKRSVLSLPPFMCPIKCAILPISGQEAFDPVAEELVQSFLSRALSTKVDNSSTSIGRRYARYDEIGVPFFITLDFQSLQDQTATIRERDSTQQIRVNLSEAVSVVEKLVNGSLSWADAYATYPQVIREDID